MDRDSRAVPRVGGGVARRGKAGQAMSGDMTWESPSGRTIHIYEHDDPHEIELAFPDGTRRYIHYVGELPERVSVDGVEYARADDDLK